MYTILVYYLYILLALVAFGVIGYVAITYFALLQRVLLRIARGGLRRIAVDENDDVKGFKLEHLDQCLVLTNFYLQEELMQYAQGFGMELNHGHVGRLAIKLPTFQRPLEIQIENIRVTLLQHPMPPHVSPEDFECKNQKRWEIEKQKRLDVVEELLWGPSASSIQSSKKRESYSAKILKYFQNQVLARLTRSAIYWIKLDIRDVNIRYIQTGEPGPRPSSNYLEGVDELQLMLRDLQVAPPSLPGKPASKSPGMSNLQNESLGHSFVNENAIDINGDTSLPSRWLHIRSFCNMFRSYFTCHSLSEVQITASGISLLLKSYPKSWSFNILDNSKSDPIPGQDFTFSAGSRSRRLSSISSRSYRPFGGNKRRKGMTKGADSKSVVLQDKKDILSEIDAMKAEEYLLFRQWGFSFIIAITPTTWKNHVNDLQSNRTNPNISCRGMTYADSNGMRSDLTKVASFSEASRQQYVSDSAEIESESSVSSSDTSDSNIGTQNKDNAARYGNHKYCTIDENKDVVRGISSKNGKYKCSSHACIEQCTSNGSSCTSRQQQDTSGVLAISLSVHLRALIPELNASSVGILARIIDRQIYFVRFGEYWCHRPQVPVTGNETVWWQHAGSSILRELPIISRKQFNMSSIEARRKSRLKYQELYISKQTENPLFREPGRRWWQLSSIKPADDTTEERLKQMERDLTLEEISYFRFGVAAKHNSKIAQNFGLKMSIIDRIHAVVFTRQTDMSREIINVVLHKDRKQDEESEQKLFLWSFSIQCPKVGVTFDLNTRSKPDKEASPHAVLALHNFSASSDLAGEVLIQTESLECGSLDGLTGPLSTRLLACPSDVCFEVCKAADFFRYSTHGRVLSESAEISQLTCISVHIAPRYGKGGHNFRDPQPIDGRQGWCPGGYDMSLELAAFGVVYDSKLVISLLSFADACDACKYAPWTWSDFKSESNSPGSHSNISKSTLLSSTEELKQQIESAFAVAEMPILGDFNIPLRNIEVHCPGIAIQLPYYHSHLSDANITKLGITEKKVKKVGKKGPDGSEMQDDNQSIATVQYLFIVTIQNIRLRITGEEYSRAFHGGSDIRTEAEGYLDIFSYLSEESRLKVAQEILPSRVMFDPLKRQFTEEVAGSDVLEEHLRETELISMAKIWSYPEDMELIAESIKQQQNEEMFLHNGASQHMARRVFRSSRKAVLGGWRSTSHVIDASRGLSQAMPKLLDDPNYYPLPILPYLKTGVVRGHRVAHVGVSPEVPGGAAVAAAASVQGIQIWESPIHIWHLVSLEKTIREIKNYMMDSKLVDSVVQEGQRDQKEGSSISRDMDSHAASKARKTAVNYKFVLTIDIDQISLLCLIGTSAAKRKKSKIKHKNYCRGWGVTVKRGDPAYVWAQWIAPVYSVSLVDLKLAFHMESSGLKAGGASIDGVLARDLQLPDGAKHAYVLRPLPARARRLKTFLHEVRQHMLGLKSVSHAQALWMRAKGKVILRIRTSLGYSNELLQKTNLKFVQSPFESFLLGPQLKVKYFALPEQRSRDFREYSTQPQQQILVEVGQMLAYVRIKENSSLTAFAAQIMQIQNVISREAVQKSTKSEAKPEKSLTVEPRIQESMKIDVVVVGIDVLFRAQSRDLMSLKLQQGRFSMDQKAINQRSSPKDIGFHVSASIKDVLLQDLRAPVQHSLVIAPNSGYDYCSVDVMYTSQVDDKKYAPSLIVNMENPRILLLFRFVADIINAVEIVNSAVSKTKNQGNKPIADTERKSTREEESENAEGEICTSNEGTKPMELVIQLQQVSVVLPLSQNSDHVLSSNINHLMLAMPGYALPSNLLHEAHLPSVETMLQESLLSATTYKFSGFGSNESKATFEKKSAARDTDNTDENVDSATRSDVNDVPRVKEESRLDFSPRGKDIFDGRRKTKSEPKRTGSLTRKGVLFYEQDQADRARNKTAGVLEVPLKIVNMQDKPERTKINTVEDDYEDNVLVGPVNAAKHVVQGTRKLVNNFIDIFEDGHGGREAGVALEGYQVGQPGSRFEMITESDPRTDVTNDESSDQEFMLQSSLTVSEPTLAICIEGFQILTGHLVARSKAITSSEAVHSSKDNSAGGVLRRPSSITSFSWPKDYFDVVSRSVFLKPTNLGIVFFQAQSKPNSSGPAQLHFSSTPLSLTLSSPNYASLMNFIRGNLNDLNSQDCSENAEEPFRYSELRFNPEMKFGPPAGCPVFRLTVAVPELSTILEANPHEWSSSKPSWSFTPISESHDLSPFFHAAVSNVLLDLGTLEGGDMHMKICATSLDMHDLRVGYRLDDLSKPLTIEETYFEKTPVFDKCAEGLESLDHLMYTKASPFSGKSSSEDDQDESNVQAEIGVKTPEKEDADDSLHSTEEVTHLTDGNSSKTGIKLSVARRLSERSQYRNILAALKGNLEYASPDTQKQLTPNRSDGDVDRNFLPVIDLLNLSSSNSQEERGHACIRLVTAPHHPAVGEGLSTTPSRSILLGSNPNIRLEVSLAMLNDGTVAVETALSSALIQWPYFHDISLISSISNIFQLPDLDSDYNKDSDSMIDWSEPTPWLYINTILTDLEVFIPVLDAEIAVHMVAELWEKQALGKSFSFDSNNVQDYRQGSPSSPKSEFQHVADLLLAAMLLDNTESPGALALEERGLALSASVVRFAYAYGGDGESVIKTDAQDLSTFIRDPRARVNCVLQPFSFSAEIESIIPHCVEAQEFEKLQRAAVVIQRQWRQFVARRYALEAIGHKNISFPLAALTMLHRRSSSRLSSQSLDSGEMDEHTNQWKLVDQLMVDVSSPHTRSLLKNYKRVSKDRSQIMFLSQYRATSSTIVRFKTGSLTTRAAFSHIPFWQTLWGNVDRIIYASPSSVQDSTTGTSQNTSPKESNTEEFAAFRSHSLQVNGTVESAAFFLCNDKPQTFGAPDVLQFTVCQTSLAYDASSLLPDRPPNKAARLKMAIYASFLNSGTSRWEPLCDLWPMKADYIDINSTMYLSDRRTNLWLESEHLVKVTFNPASLLSFGDALAFINCFKDSSMVDEGLLDSTGSQTVALPTNRGPRYSLAGAAAAKAIPISSKSTSRAPQKYLIQNHSGIKVYYWTGGPSDDASSQMDRKHQGTKSVRSPVYTLENDCSETLKVNPVMKSLNFIHSSQTNASAKRLASVINLHFEGNWMPILDVAINVVGKYKYTMISPADNTTVPVIIDIILVGRTKIITLHSGIWVENCIDRSIKLRLHVPITSLVPPSGPGPLDVYGRSKNGQRKHRRVKISSKDGDIIIGPIDPGCGCYLPLTSALDGLLFLQPEGFQEAARDVVRLSANVSKMLLQQGCISCDPSIASAFDDEGNEIINDPLHLAVEATPSGIQSDFQAFKHMECISGTIQHAADPIEVYLSIQATIMISNALPYEMRVLLWQVSPNDTLKENSTSREGTPKNMSPVRGSLIKESILEMLSPRSSGITSCKGHRGKYIILVIPPGAEHKAHIDLNQNVLIHISIEDINMRSIKWAVCNLAEKGFSRGENEKKVSNRLPRHLQLRIVSVGMPLPLDEDLVEDYLSRLKQTGSLIGAAHKQFTRDWRSATTPADVQTAFDKIKFFAKSISHRKERDPNRLASPRSVTEKIKKDTEVALEARKGPLRKVLGGIRKNRKAMQGTKQAGSASQEGMPTNSLGSDTNKVTDEIDGESNKEVPDNSIVVSNSSENKHHDKANSQADRYNTENTQPSASNSRPAMRPPPLKIYNSAYESPDYHKKTSNRGFGSDIGEPSVREDSLKSDDERKGEVRSPYLLQVGIHNSLAHQERGKASACRLLLYVPYWVNNRTGVDLFLKDKLSAPSIPMIGASIPGSFGEVFAPGTSMTETYPDNVSEITGNTQRLQGDNSQDETKTDDLGLKNAGIFDNNSIDQTLLEYKLVFMNKQDELSIGLGHIQMRRYSQPVNIKTVGNKGTIQIKGPGCRIEESKSTSVQKLNRLKWKNSNEPPQVDMMSHYWPDTPGHFADLVDSNPGTMMVRISTTRRGTREHRNRKTLSTSSDRDNDNSRHEKFSEKSNAAAALKAMKTIPTGNNGDMVSHFKMPRRGVGSNYVQHGFMELERENDISEDKDEVGDQALSATESIPSYSQQEIEPATGSEESLNMYQNLQRNIPGLLPNFTEIKDDSRGDETGLYANMKQTKRVRSGQRLFEFAIDVTSGPPNSIYRHTKLVTLKPKYIIENQTGICIDIKQANVDLAEDEINSSDNISDATRLARLLAPGQRAAVYWDDAEMPRELVIRPRIPGDPDEAWFWSGAFPIPDTEWYFGLRIRHRTANHKHMNIPVNVTVGSTGSVQVTLKRPTSVPPYRIENRCKDVHLFFAQVPLVFRDDGQRYVDSLEPNEAMPYAWDEPTLLPKLRVQARVGQNAVESRVADYSLDYLGDAPMMMLPTHNKPQLSIQNNKLYDSLSADLPQELKRKLASLLAAEFSKKVYVSVYADGPTRVLRFSDERAVSSLEHQHIILDLAARLKQVEEELGSVNARFSRLSGVSGSRAYALDLYGRMPNLKRKEKKKQKSNLQPRMSRKLKLPESTQVLLNQASLQATRHKLHSRNASLSNISGLSDPETEADKTLREKFSDTKSKKHTKGLTGRVRFSFKDQDQEKGRVYAETSENNSKRRVETSKGNILDTVKKDKGKEDTHPSYDLHGKEAAHSDLGDLNTYNQFESQSSALTDYSFQSFELFQVMASSDAVLLIGGDLNVTICRAQNLHGHAESTHPFARLKIAEPYPSALDEQRAKQTSVIWQTNNPIWEEEILFRDVCAASELIVELWDLGGTKSAAQLSALSSRPAEMISSCRFLGCAEVPLGETLESASSSTPLWFPLMRRTSSDVVSGRVQLRFSWDITTRGLLAIKLAALERVLAQRQEILAALQPITANTSMHWNIPNPGVRSIAEEIKAAASESTVVGLSTSNFRAGSISGSVFKLFSSQRSPLSGSLLLHPSSVAAEVLARHAEEAGRRHLVVTVLEARGLVPRRGVVVALSANELPNPVVTVSIPGFADYSTPPAPHTLTPRWPADVRHVFKGTDHTETEISISLGDFRGELIQRLVPLAKGKLHASNIPVDKPVYVWVPLYSVNKKTAEAVEVMGSSHRPPELQVFLRLQWETEIPRGSSLKLDINAAGAGLMVVGGLQDELFNLTFDRLQSSAVQTHLELMVKGTINKIQLDNQMLNAVEPVVLAPDVGAKVYGAAKAGPMVSFGFTRSFAGSSRKQISVDDDMAKAATAAAHEVGNSSDTDSDALSAFDVDIVNLEANAADVRSISKGDSKGIRSFKDVYFTVAPLDFMTDEAFLESLIAFMNSLPMADVWQDHAWQNQQYRLLNAQFGPREVESLAVNAAIKIPSGPSRVTAPSIEEISNQGTAPDVSNISPALAWIVHKEAKDLETLHGQSDFSSWFFIENAEISEISINVTISLTSRLIAAASGGSNNGDSYVGDSYAGPSGSFGRTLGASGFQLVNVSNVPITLGKWMVGNDPSIRGRFSNGFLSQRALTSNLLRHYTRESLKEAHKVLGGAGPAVAAVPFTVLWASGSIVFLVREVTTGSRGPIAAMQQVWYVPMMSFSMIFSSLSRMIAAAMVFTPPSRPGGDDVTVRRVIRRPNNSLEALAAAPREIGWGCSNAAVGLIFDPIAGWHWLSAPGLALGLVKGIVGIPARPTIGLLEFGADVFAAVAMTALGRDGIVGKMQRRMRPPGAFSEDGTEGIIEDSQRQEIQHHNRALQAAWQRVLPDFFPDLGIDKVTDVLYVRTTRVLLVTDRHIAYLRARHLGNHSIYKPKWLIPLSEIQNIRGDSESWKITLVHIRKYDLKFLGVWPVQKRKSLRCAGRGSYEQTLARLTLVQQSAQGISGFINASGGDSNFIAPSLEDLTILSKPYIPVQPQNHS